MDSCCDIQATAAEIDETIELTAEQAREVAEVDGEIDRLDCLLSEVIRDHIEAAEEGWPDADSKYDDLESQIRDANGDMCRMTFMRHMFVNTALPQDEAI